MITVNNLAFQFGGQLLFKDVDLKFTPGNCYGIIGANGAGKSTFLRILCGELEPTRGEVYIPETVRMSVLKQNHFAYDEYTVLDTVIMGNSRLYEIMKEKDAIYSKEDFSEEDGMRASELEGEFAELNGWEAESDASKLIQGLGLTDDYLYMQMSSLLESESVPTVIARPFSLISGTGGKALWINILDNGHIAQYTFFITFFAASISSCLRQTL